MNKPLISIITISYNAANTIERTILSIINQTYSNIEYIIEDGKSKDGTLDIVNKYKHQISAIYSEKDKGIFDAMNKALHRSTGEWIIFMNAGDTFHNNEVISNIFETQIPKEISVIYGDVYFITSKGLQYIKCNPFYNKKGIRPMGICHQSIFTQRDAALKFCFDLKFKYTADYNMMMQIHKAGFEFKYIPIAISNYDLTGISSTNSISQYKEVAKICNITSGIKYYMGILVIWKRKIKTQIKKLLNYNI